MTDQTDYVQQMHTDEIQEIIGSPPSWLLQWGITIFLVILVGILSLSAIISYPDVISAQLKIRSVQQPVTISCSQTGRLLKVLVRNNDIVKEKQALAIVAIPNGTDTLLATNHGTLSYFGIVHEGSQIDSKLPLFIISDDRTEFFGELIIPQSSIASVQVGQKVVIKLNSYPYQEYGTLSGKIKYITQDFRNSERYLAEVKLDNASFTSVGKQINLKPSMIANADIITHKSSLLKRLANNVFRNISQSN